MDYFYKDSFGSPPFIVYYTIIVYNWKDWRITEITLEPLGSRVSDLCKGDISDYRDKDFDYIKSRLFRVFRIVKDDIIKSDKEEICKRYSNKSVFAIVEKSQYGNSIIGYTVNSDLDTVLNISVKTERTNKVYTLTKIK